MQIEFQSLSPNQRYHLLTQTVIPRPIAWVLSQNQDASFNLAPFSFFNALCSEPAILMMSIGKKPTGEYKDTAVNLGSGRPFVIHIANAKQAEALTSTASNLAYGESEVTAADLKLIDMPGAELPRLADCDVAYYCRLYQQHFFGPKNQAIIYAEVINLYLSDNVATQCDNRITIDANVVNPLSRLGAAQYAEIGPAFSIKRPD